MPLLVNSNQSIHVDGFLPPTWQLTKSNYSRGGNCRNGQYGYGLKGHYGVPSIHVDGFLPPTWQLTKSNYSRGGNCRNGQYGYGLKGHYGVPSIMGRAPDGRAGIQTGK